MHYHSLYSHAVAVSVAILCYYERARILGGIVHVSLMLALKRDIEWVAGVLLSLTDTGVTWVGRSDATKSIHTECGILSGVV